MATTAARSSGDPAPAPRPDPGTSQKTAPLLLGLGLGGFLDGIVLHQVLQWHHMLTSTADGPFTTIAGLERNTLVDGFFHLATWMLVVAAITMMFRSWRAGRPAPPPRVHVGLILVGWGMFNLVEGTIDHLILGIHHVRDDLGGPLGWDLAFLALGAVQVGGGLALARSAGSDPR
ncbi:MAG TPA: DUF2243 domain-containing protein [Solirubrobacteraceae bacterium]|nr:DUF2243 domain-containing protein [Solirubrobacteraceae bacterium]